jgi:hypothetical protein
MTTGELQGLMRICFESTYLLFNTKNINTLITRFSLLNEHLPTLAQFENADGYFEAMKNEELSYVKTYPDRKVEEYQIAAIFKPSEFKLNHIYLNCICNCSAKFVKDKMEEIGAMKQQRAKKKRVEEILSTMDLAKKELEDNCKDTPQYNQGVEAIHLCTREAMVLKIADNII